MTSFSKCINYGSNQLGVTFILNYYYHYYYFVNLNQLKILVLKLNLRFFLTTKILKIVKIANKQLVILMKGNKKNNQTASPRQIIKFSNFFFVKKNTFFLDLPTKYLFNINI